MRSAKCTSEHSDYVLSTGEGAWLRDLAGAVAARELLSLAGGGFLEAFGTCVSMTSCWEGLATGVLALRWALFLAIALFFAMALTVVLFVAFAGFFASFLIAGGVALEDAFLVVLVFGATALVVFLAVFLVVAFTDFFVPFLIAGGVVLAEAFLATRGGLGVGT